MDVVFMPNRRSNLEGVSVFKPELSGASISVLFLFFCFRVAPPFSLFENQELQYMTRLTKPDPESSHSTEHRRGAEAN